MKVRYTVPSAVTRAAYVGNGVTTVFSVPFNFFVAGDLDVISVNAATAVETVKALTADYTVTGGGGLTGSVTMIVAPPAGTTLVIERDIPFTQAIDLEPNDPFPAEVTEEGFDRATMLAQQNRLEGQKSPKLPSTYDPDVTGEIRIPMPESGKLLSGKSDGSGWENATVASITAAAIPVLLSSVANLDTLRYKSSAAVWINVPSAEYDISLYGGSPGNADNSTALLAALTAATGAGGSVVFPAGVFTFTGAVSKTLTSKVCIRGAGRDITVLRFTGAGGLSLTFSGQTNAPRVNGLTIETSTAGGGTGLTITCSPALTTAYAIGPIVSDFCARGTNTATTYWDTHIHLVDVWYAQLTNFSLTGKDELVLPFSSAEGVKYTRCQVVYLRDFSIQHVTDAVVQKGTTFGEGLNASNFELVGVKNGFNLSSWLSGDLAIQGIQNGHINAYARGITTSYIVQANYSGLLIYKTDVSAENFIGIELLTGANNCRVANNHIEDNLSATGTWVGVLLGTNATTNAVTGNTFDWAKAANVDAIVLGTNANNNSISANVTGAKGLAIDTVTINADAGANNIIVGNLARGSGVAVTNNSTVQQCIRNNHPLVARLFLQNDTTPSVMAAQHEIWRTNNSVPTTITALDDGVLGQVVHLQLNDANTGFTHNAASFILRGGVNIAVGTGAGYTISFIYLGAAWIELARSF